MLNIKRTVEVNQTSWTELKESAEAGKLGELLHSGDTLSITLKDGEAVTLRVAQDQKGKLYFVFEDCLSETHNMNDRLTYKGGWSACGMRAYLNGNIFDRLPDDLQAAIKPTTIVQVIDGQRVETSDKLFLLSYTQMCGQSKDYDKRYAEIEPEDTQLDIYTTEKSRVKEIAGNGTWWYWLRSPLPSDAGHVRGIYPSGRLDDFNARYTHGVAPAFCI